MSAKKKIIALCLFFSVTFAFVLSLGVAGLESVHECSGEDCQICYELNLCKNNARKLLCAAALGVSVAVMFFFAAEAAVCAVSIRVFATPVSLKVKLSD